MAKRERERFTPNHRSKGHAATATVTPRWFIREAVGAFNLNLSDVAVFLAIADNLDQHGVSRTATGLIVSRAGVARATAVRSVATLIDHGLIFELAEKRSGVIMQYGIPPQMPWPHL